MHGSGQWDGQGKDPKEGDRGCTRGLDRMMNRGNNNKKEAFIRGKHLVSHHVLTNKNEYFKC